MIIKDMLSSKLESKLQLNYRSFPCGFFLRDFFSKEFCQKLKIALNNSIWIPALVARYEGSEYLGIENNSKISTALVTKGFRFADALFDIKELQNNLHK